MILVVVGGIVLFLFKVGVEVKDVVVIFKFKMENSNVEVGIGFLNWLEFKLVEFYLMVVYVIVV